MNNNNNNLNFNIYTLDSNPESHEFILQFDDSDSLQNFHENNTVRQMNYQIESILIPWNPSEKLQNLFNKFQKTILNQFPCLLCSNCGYLLYPEKAKWISYEENIIYPFQVAFPRSKLLLHPHTPARIAVCSACKNKPNRVFPSYLLPIPSEIQAIPLSKRKYLSPIYLHSLMGRTSGANPFSIS